MSNRLSTALHKSEHWNEDHSDILEQSFPPYQEAEQERHELESGVFQVRTHAQYLTVYDVLAADDQEAIFDAAFVEKVLFNEACEDCRTPVEELDEFEELGKHGPVTTYLCHECRKQRTIRRRKANNRSLSAFERA